MQFVIDMTECKWNGAIIFWRQCRSGREAPWHSVGMNSTYRSGRPAAKPAIVTIGCRSVQKLAYLSAACRKSKKRSWFSVELELVMYLKFYSHQLIHFSIQLCISLISYIKITKHFRKHSNMFRSSMGSSSGSSLFTSFSMLLILKIIKIFKKYYHPS